jgi:Cu(I)/Ag(I) efflux system membrane protein CusA/SilA
MWSTSVGAEMMKPLATPVLGGMISSLAHVLIVTPVIFFSIRARQLGLPHEEEPIEQPAVDRRRVAVATMAIVLVVAGAFIAWRLTRSAESDAVASDPVVQTVGSGDLRIVLRSPTGTLHTGRNTFTIEFRSVSDALVDVGVLRIGATMTMPGMVLPGNVQVQPSGVPGRYDATAEFGMAGAWPITIEWDGPAGRGKANVEGSVQ